MNKNIKVLSVIIALTLLFSAFTFSVFAEPNDTIVSTPPADTVPDPGTDVNPDPGTDVNPDPDPGTDVNPDPGTDVDPDQGTTDPTTAPDEGGSTTTDPTVPDSGNTQTPTDSYVDNNDYGDDFYYYDEDEMVNNIEHSAGSVSDATNLYDTSDLNEAALKETKWDDIVLDTTKPETNAMDFSAIKENTRNDDDSQWILYTGYTLLALSAVGILYFIIATATYKKKLKNLKQRQTRYDSNRRRDNYADEVDFSDNYSHHSASRPQRKRYASDGMGYAQRKRLKADTADIELPAKYRARH